MTLQEHEVEEWVDGLSVIRISRTGTRWQAGGAADIALLTREQLAERIAAKDKLLPRYRTRRPGFQMWLLLTTDIRVLRSVAVPDGVRTWQFSSGFDKVLLMPWDDIVIELQNTGPSSSKRTD